jgi:hypothetical protein
MEKIIWHRCASFVFVHCTPCYEGEYLQMLPSADQGALHIVVCQVLLCNCKNMLLQDIDIYIARVRPDGNFHPDTNVVIH